MSNQSPYFKQAAVLATALSFIALSSIGGADSVVEKRKRQIADQELFFAPVPKAVCGPGDKPETALQGQVPVALRLQPGGYQGNSCNLQLLGQVRGEGANWQTTEFREGRGKSRKACAYHGTASPTYAPSAPYQRANYGVRVIDISDPAKPLTTAYLQTSAMLDPWESLKVNERRKLLAADNGQNGGAGPDIDIYDVSGDCRYPQLLASRRIGVNPDVDPIVATVTGHEGAWAPDGLTYYGGGGYFAVDITNTTQPTLLATWRNPPYVGGGHGMSISDDGTRGYFIAVGGFGNLPPGYLTDPSVPATNGVVIYDLSDIQMRRPSPQVRVVSTIVWKDGSIGQHTIPITIGKKPYLVGVDEGGSGGLGAAAFTQACNAGLALFAMARIIDISDEKNPRVVSKLMTEVHDPANCDKIQPDIVGQGGFLYGAHYCSVDNRSKATTLACGYQNSGIRIFDIRDPIRPREIAYYNPPATNDVSPGSNHIGPRVAQPGGPDWCSAQVHLDAATSTVWSTCQDNGLLSLKFTHNAWPFAETRTPPGRQN